MEQSYPYSGPLLQPESQRQPRPGFYDVAIWKYWPSYGLPFVADLVQASSPWKAIEKTMRACGLQEAGHAAATPCGHQSLIAYRVYGVCLADEEKHTRTHWAPPY